ncbi:hypothetical protein BCR43DRAFT_501701 [Syncephalastrum racemosum]|uniref:F-box domain-containing protein n=1 Tax=Syncephalastrum racemosum TaxID=13706 RepID=A0A1X2HWG0_SYNRA|nr:hypothetical protein BCR43DRAFT_501701 [Syncephalastrum racemosum]
MSPNAKLLGMAQKDISYAKIVQLLCLDISSVVQEMIDEKLPFDIFCDVFGELTFRDRVRCTGVSRRWRDILLVQWPGMWHTIEYKDTRWNPDPSEFMGFLAWLSNAPPGGVRYLTCIHGPAFLNALVDLLYHKRFPRLQALRLISRNRLRMPPSLDPRKLLADRLERLELAHFRPPDDYGDSPTSARIPSHNYLTEFRWSSDVPLPLFMVKQWPNLRLLAVWSYAIQGKVPELPSSSSTSHLKADPTGGLEKLILRPYDYDDTIYAADLVFRNRRTLLHLDINASQVDIRPFIEMPRLQHLHVTNTVFSQRQILDLVACCPQLQILHLEGLSCTQFEAGEQRSAELEEERSIPLPCLRKIVLNECNWVDDTFIRSLNKLDALTDVSIRMCYGITEMGRNILLIDKAPNLERLYFT